jgi:hypothetical protein
VGPEGGHTSIDVSARSAPVADFAIQGEKMKYFATLNCYIAALVFCGSAAAAGTDIKGAAILDHPCGKVSVKQMGLVHDGKMEEANKLTTKEMQAQWKAMPASDRMMMTGMMKEMSSTEQQYANDIKSNGVLVVDGQAATLTVKKTTKDKNGSSTSTMTQNFKLDGAQCLISR